MSYSLGGYYLGLWGHSGSGHKLGFGCEPHAARQEVLPEPSAPASSCLPGVRPLPKRRILFAADQDPAGSSPRLRGTLPFLTRKVGRR